MTHPRPAPRARARIIHGPTSKAALHLEAAVDVLAWPISGDEVKGQRLGRGIEGQLWQRLAELEVATYGESLRCSACNGWGVASVMQHDGNEDTYQCLDCGGSGDGPLSIGDVSRRGPLVIRMEEAQARRIIAREIEARRPGRDS